MPATANLLQIVWDATTIDLLDGANYQLVDEGWSSTPPRERQSVLGGRSPYEDAVSRIRINIMGDTAAETLANYQTLLGVLRQVKAWKDRDGLPVIFRVQPLGSVLADPLESTITEDLTDEIPDTFFDWLMIKEVMNVTISFRHTMPYRAAEEQEESTGTTYAGSQMTATFATSPNALTPGWVGLGGFSATDTPLIPASFLLIGPSTYIARVEAELLDNGAEYDAVVEGTYKASGGHILVYTPTTTDPVTSDRAATGALTENFTQAAIFATVRNPSAADFTVEAVASSLYVSSVGATVTTRPVLIEAGNTNPQVVFLGSAALRGGLSHIALRITASTVVGSPTLEVDQIVILGTASRVSRALALGAMDVSGFAGDLLAPFLVVDATPTDPTPRVEVRADGVMPLDYRGDAYILHNGTTISAVWLATGGGDDRHWRFTKQDDTLCAITLTGVRTPGYGIPE